MTGGTEDVGVEAVAAGGGAGAANELEPVEVLAVEGVTVVEEAVVAAVVLVLVLAGMEAEAWPGGPDKGFPQFPPSARSPPW